MEALWIVLGAVGGLALVGFIVFRIFDHAVDEFAKSCGSKERED